MLDVPQNKATGALTKPDDPAEADERRAAEVELDQCWDLLRQRRAKRDYGNEADDAQVRPPSVVEHYLQ